MNECIEDLPNQAKLSKNDSIQNARSKNEKKEELMFSESVPERLIKHYSDDFEDYDMVDVATNQNDDYGSFF